MRSLGFVPSKAEEDIWMRDMGDHYEYVASYVDDLLIARSSQAPAAMLKTSPCRALPPHNFVEATTTTRCNNSHFL